MLLIRRHDGPCPFCSTTDFRSSRTRRLEWLLRLAGVNPRRCRQCNLRFWTVNAGAAARVLLMALVLAAAGLLVWWVVSAAVILGMPTA